MKEKISIKAIEDKKKYQYVKKYFLKALLDGFISSLVLDCLDIFLLSVYASSLSLKQYLLLGVLGAMISSAIYFVFILKESSNKNILRFSLMSIFSFILCMAIMLGIHLTFSIDFLPLREVNNGDGIMLLFTIGSFILSSIVIRFYIFSTLIIKNLQQRKIRK